MLILIVDDHPLTCQGLAALLAGALPQARVQPAYTAQTARAALDRLPEPDWVFLDLHLADDPQHTLYHHLCSTRWIERTVLISADPSHALVRQALAAGVRGFIPKTADPGDVLSGFDRIRQGVFFLPERLTHLTAADQSTAIALSPRLAQVQDLLLKGTPNKLIARELGLSEHTVKEYCSSVLAFHGAANRLELVLKLSRSGQA